MLFLGPGHVFERSGITRHAMVEHRTEPLLNIKGMQVFREVDNFHPLARERTQATGRPLVGRVEMRSVRYRLQGGVGSGDHVSLFIDNDNHFHTRPRQSA